jgi:hypothetical protein
MNNSRSKTKIRRIQDINILSEQRYLKSKNSLNEQSNEPNPKQYLECLMNIFGDFSNIPTSCTGTIFPPKAPDIRGCIGELKKKFPDKIEEFATCAEIDLTMIAKL